MDLYAKVIKELKLPEFEMPLRVGETLDIRFNDPENPDDKGVVYKDNQRVCDVPSSVSDEFLQIIVGGLTRVARTATWEINELRVIRTEHGFLDDCIDEGFWQEDDAPNYSFTDNPYQAAVFPNDDTVPKYLGVTPFKKLLTAQDCADYVGGELVTIRVTKTVTWDIID